MARHTDDFIVQTKGEQVFSMRPVKGYDPFKRMIDGQDSSSLIDNRVFTFNSHNSGRGFIYTGAVNQPN